MSTELIDICFNLANKAFRNQEAELIQRAVRAGVSRMMVTGSTSADSRQCIALAERFPGELWATAGVHPHHASEWNDKTQYAIADMAAHEKVMAVGEAGLDFNRNFSTPGEQKRAFEAQLEIAADLDLPVFLHERDAHEAFIKILARYRERLAHGGVVHCFTGTGEALAAYLDMDLHIGITGWICDERRGQHLRGLIHRIPLERLMIETDAPYLLPRDIKPRPKSRHNEPAFLPHIAQTIADILDCPQGLIARETTRTARAFYALP